MKFIDTKELVYKKLDFTIKGLQKAEIGVLFGAGGAGKGYFLKHFFESDKNMLFVKKLNILYCSLEDNLSTIQNKFNNKSGIHNVSVSFEENSDYWADFDLIVIDTWSRFLKGKYEENSNKEMSAAYEELIEKAKKYNVSVLVVAHTNKSAINSEEDLNIGHLRGAGSLADNSRLAISVEKTKLDKNIVKASIQKANNTSFETQFFNISENGTLVLESKKNDRY
jgi:L-lactate utilization protein LutC